MSILKKKVLFLAITILVVIIAGCNHKESLNVTTQLTRNKELVSLNPKEKTYVGMNYQQFFSVTREGIKMYNIDGEELWKDTFDFEDYVVMQREPYIAIGSKEGYNIQVFYEKGKVYEITSQDEIVYFSLNEAGGVVTISRDDSTYKITAYDGTGKLLCRHTTYAKEDGYPLTAELSPNNQKLIMAYVAADEPQVVSRIYIIDVAKAKDATDRDAITYGCEQKDNLIYEIEFITKNIWVTIGDQQIVWYDLEGNEQASISHKSLVFVPYLYKMSVYGMGYLPIIVSEKPMKNIAHRKDQLIYFNGKGEETFSVDLNNGVESCYANQNGIIVQIGNIFRGYDKLGNPYFEYRSDIDLNKVIYIPDIHRGIAVNKESIFLLLPK